MSESYDLVVIGGGPGGYVCAIRAAQLGMRVAMIEKRDADNKKGPSLGGTCLNVGCIPSKALLDSSERFHDAGHVFKEHGIVIDTPKLDLGMMMKRKGKVVTALTTGVAFLMKKNKVTVVPGTARLGNNTQVIISKDGDEQTIEAKNIVLAMGSEATELPSLPFDGDTVISSTEALNLSEVPEKLVVVGGGVIGLELSQVWSRLGAKVTVLEFMDQIVPGMDPELAGGLQKVLTKQGISFHLGSKVQKVEGGQVIAEDAKGETQSYPADKVLVAVGRRPRSEGLAEAGINLDDHGRVITDKNYATNRGNVFAIGDLIAGPMLAHKAEEEGVAVAEIIAGHKAELDHDLIPGVVYTEPEFAVVGMSETKAAEKGHNVKVGKFPFIANGRAKAAGHTDGMVKMVTDADSDRLLGVHILGPRASDLIAECVAVMSFGGSSEDIARICHAHPTFSEAVKEAALDANGRILHG